MDIDFVEALFFIQEMSDDDHFEELSGLHDPELLKRPHAEVMILKPKSFMYFQSDQKSPDIFALPSAQTMCLLH